VSIGGSPSNPCRIACVSYLNSKPLIYGLDRRDDVRLMLDVPANLLRMLRQDRCDVAMLPVIDYQAMDDLIILPAAAIGCDGPTLTVRIFSREPIHRMTALACDPDSHTSVALARILLKEVFGLWPELLGLPEATEDVPRLLIGDKVVLDEPRGFAHQLDLGELWKRWSGLPFVFATWMARRRDGLGTLHDLLGATCREGMANIERILQAHAVPAGWPIDIARRYFTQCLRYEFGPAQQRAVKRFHGLALEHGVLSGPLKPLRVYRGSASTS
jgi:chorismate dehydratase